MRLAAFESPFQTFDLTLTGRYDQIHPFGEFTPNTDSASFGKHSRAQSGVTDTGIRCSTVSDRIPFIINSNTNH